MDPEEMVMVKMAALFSAAISLSGNTNTHRDVLRRANTFNSWLLKGLEELDEK